MDEDILFLIIPIQEGCHGCVAKAMSFVDQNSTLIQSVSEFEIIASSIYDKRVFDLSTYKCVLAPFIVDTSNVYARRVNLGIYPLLVRREGSEVDILKLESENIDDVLSKLERGLLTRNKKYFEFWSVFSYFEGNRN